MIAVERSEKERQDGAPPPPEDSPFPLVFGGEAARPSLWRRIMVALRVWLRREPASPSAQDVASPSGPAKRPRPEPSPSPTSPPPPAPSPSSAPRLVPRAEAGDGVRRATLQLLPGRLQPLDPDQLAQEIRFLRAGPEATVVTLGWDAEEPPSHITLDHPSIQARHARMSYRGGQWAIESLSEWDPVQVNGTPLPPGEEPRVLWSGDEVRIGEVTFRFMMS